MKRVLAATTLAVFGLAPAIGMACDYNDASASAAPSVLVGSASLPQATRMPAPAVVKATPAPTAAKPVMAKVKTPVSDQKVAASNAR